MKSFILKFAMYEIGIPVLFMNFLYFSLYFLCFRAKSSNPLSSLLTATLHRGLRNCFCFTSHLLFPYSFWTFIPLFSLDFYFPFVSIFFIQSQAYFGFIPKLCICFVFYFRQQNQSILSKLSRILYMSVNFLVNFNRRQYQKKLLIQRLFKVRNICFFSPLVPSKREEKKTKYFAP